MRKMIPIFILILFFSIFLSACSSPDPAIEGSWIINEEKFTSDDKLNDAYEFAAEINFGKSGSNEKMYSIVRKSFPYNFGGFYNFSDNNKLKLAFSDLEDIRIELILDFKLEGDLLEVTNVTVNAPSSSKYTLNDLTSPYYYKRVNKK